jgi:hypothetical protein
MATPLLTSSDRFTSLGTTRVYIVPSIAATNLTPTRTEMNNAVDVTEELNDWAGWSLARADIPTPDLASTFESNIPGKMTAEQSSLTLYADSAGVDIRTVLSIDTATNVMFCDGGDVPGNTADVYPVKVKSMPKQRSVNGEAADKMMVQFSITRQPAENVIIPA